MTEDDWDLIAPWNTDPRVLWFTGNGAVSQRSPAYRVRDDVLFRPELSNGVEDHVALPRVDH